MQIRRIALRTADGLNPTPMAISWVRDGVLMCAMDNEIAVYSQWREDARKSAAAVTTGSAASSSNDAADGGRAGSVDKDIVDHRNLQEADILSLATVRIRKKKFSPADQLAFPQESQMRNIRSTASYSTLPAAASSLKVMAGGDAEKRKKGKRERPSTSCI